MEWFSQLTQKPYLFLQMYRVCFYIFWGMLFTGFGSWQQHQNDSLFIRLTPKNYTGKHQNDLLRSSLRFPTITVSRDNNLNENTTQKGNQNGTGFIQHHLLALTSLRNFRSNQLGIRLSFPHNPHYFCNWFSSHFFCWYCERVWRISLLKW